MTIPTIPEAAVEAAATSLYEREYGVTDWGFVSVAVRSRYLEEAATALEAAAPHMRRTITTAEELDELPAGSVIRDPLNCIKWGDGSWGTFTDDTYPSSRIDLPATVLYEPDPAK